MDLFILDSQFRRTACIDQYTSLIWTERYSSSGDFQLDIPSSLNARTLLQPNTHLAINESTRIMTIESVEDKSDDEGRVSLTVKGPSLEDILSDRTARNLDITNPNNDPTDLAWYFVNQLPGDILQAMFDYVVTNHNLDDGDIIPFLTAGNIYPTDTIPFPDTPVSLNVQPTDLYSAIKELCDIYELGFRLVRNGDNSELMFNFYSGNDRTTLQSTLPAVIFAPELDNLTDTSFLTQTGAYKNVAYVWSPDGVAWAYADNVDPTVSGFDRKVLTVDGSSIRYPDRSQIDPLPYTITDDEAESVKTAQQLTTTTQLQSDSLAKLTKMQRLLPQDSVNINTVLTLVGTTLTSTDIDNINSAVTKTNGYNDDEDSALQLLLVQKGKDELSKNTNLAAFDGEIPKNSQYIYGRDYQLGDLVEIRNSDQVTNQMRVTEQIFASDDTGDHAYPTLAEKLLISRGSWYAEPSAEVWDDLTDPADTWDSRP